MNTSTGRITPILARFPKARPPLSAPIQAIYARQYKENRTGETAAASVAQRLEGWMHRQVAADVAADITAGQALATLELGAGTLNQLRHEPLTAPYDIVEPFTALFAGAPERDRVRHAYADISEVRSDSAYARITSIAALEHICDLPLVLARSARLLTSDGVFRAAIPAEGGLLWQAGWSLTTGLEFRLRHGLDYGELMRHEHVNTAAEIEMLIGVLFQDTKIKSFGLGRQLSLYRFIEARQPRPEVAEAWIARYA